MKTVQKYKEIEQYILNLIAEQNLKPGNKIPTEIELCKQSGYSRMTINKALNHLADEGHIVRTRGKGSFVASPSVYKQVQQFRSFTDDMQSIGLKAGSKLLSYSVIQAKENPTVQQMLQLEDDDLVHDFVRLRTGNDTPIALSHTWISEKIIPMIPPAQLEHSLVTYIKEQYSVKPEHAEFEFSAKIPTSEQKKLLQLNNQEALLLSAHTTYCDFYGEILPGITLAIQNMLRITMVDGSVTLKINKVTVKNFGRNLWLNRLW